MAKKKLLDHPSRVNELHPELLAMHALNYSTAYNAPARGTMFSGHFAQRPVIAGSEPNLIQTGVEEEFGKYTFNVKMPEDGTILRVIPRYQQGIADDSINFNPETLVVYRSHETGKVGCFTVPYHCSHHPSFGFEYAQKEAANGLSVGMEFAKDTIFADSPAVHGESHYTYGKNLNVVYMSHPNVGLDGYVISRDVLPDFNFKVYETRSVGLGANLFPKNLYGDDENHKSFPDIGEYIREDGLLMAAGRNDPYLAPALLSKRDLRRVDYLFDEKIYVRPGKGRIVDIRVVRSTNMNRQLPEQMTRQMEKYASASERFHREIVKLEEQLIQESRKNGMNGKIDVSLPLHRLIVTSKGILNYGVNRAMPALTLTYKREPLDSWRLEFTIEYEITPNRGFKLSCTQGGGPRLA